MAYSFRNYHLRVKTQLEKQNDREKKRKEKQDRERKRDRELKTGAGRDHFSASKLSQCNVLTYVRSRAYTNTQG